MMSLAFWQWLCNWDTEIKKRYLEPILCNVVSPPIDLHVAVGSVSLPKEGHSERNVCLIQHSTVVMQETMFSFEIPM